MLRTTIQNCLDIVETTPPRDWNRLRYYLFLSVKMQGGGVNVSCLGRGEAEPPMKSH